MGAVLSKGSEQSIQALRQENADLRRQLGSTELASQALRQENADLRRQLESIEPASITAISVGGSTIAEFPMAVTRTMEEVKDEILRHAQKKVSTKLEVTLCVGNSNVPLNLKSYLSEHLDGKQSIEVLVLWQEKPFSVGDGFFALGGHINGWRAEFKDSDFLPQNTQSLRSGGTKVQDPGVVDVPRWCDHGSKLTYNDKDDLWEEFDYSQQRVSGCWSRMHSKNW